MTSLFDDFQFGENKILNLLGKSVSDMEHLPFLSQSPFSVYHSDLNAAIPVAAA